MADTSHHALSDPLARLAARAMYGGVALYLLAHVGFRCRIWHHVFVQRVVARRWCSRLIPLAAVVPALGALGLLTAVLVG